MSSFRIINIRSFVWSQFDTTVKLAYNSITMPERHPEDS